MKPVRPTRHLRSILLATLVAALLALAWPTGAAKALTTDSGWFHVLDVVAALNETPPEIPLVVLLGGSAARESTVSDGDWAAQVQRRGAPPS